jgi:hypothetical protein
MQKDEIDIKDSLRGVLLVQLNRTAAARTNRSTLMQCDAPSPCALCSFLALTD